MTDYACDDYAAIARRAAELKKEREAAVRGETPAPAGADLGDGFEEEFFIDWSSVYSGLGI